MRKQDIVPVVIIDKNHMYYLHGAKLMFKREDAKFAIDVHEVDGTSLGIHIVEATQIMTTKEYTEALTSCGMKES